MDTYNFYAHNEKKNNRFDNLLIALITIALFAISLFWLFTSKRGNRVLSIFSKSEEREIKIETGVQGAGIQEI